MLRKVQKKIRRREDNFIRKNKGKNKGKQPKPPTFLIKKTIEIYFVSVC